MGRPHGYSEEIVSVILERIAEGESLNKICKDDAMPSKSTVFKWLTEIEGFSDRYTRAREAQADVLFDEILEIADDGLNDTYTDAEGNERTNQDVIARSRLRVDARKWMAGKLRPKKYGEKLELSGDPDRPLQTVARIELVALDNSTDRAPS